MDKIKKYLFFRSKVARKLFLLFVFCSIIPLVTISTVSLFYVGSQLKTEALKRLHQQCKSKGILIFERLAALDAELKSIGEDYSSHGLRKINSKPFDPFEREGSGWTRIFLKKPDGQIDLIVQNIENLPDINLQAISYPEKNHSALVILKDPKLENTILLIKPTPDETGAIIGEVNPLYLWGIGITGSLPPEIDLTIVLPSGEVLISSIPDYKAPAEFLEAYREHSFSGNFQHTLKGKTYINSYWSLFLKHRFASPDWTIIFSQTHSSVMLPVSNFRNIFFLMVLLSFWIILLLSLRAIRIKTIPIDQLKKAAQEIANGDLGHQVSVSSGDEFDILADTFNEMSLKLKQGQTILLQTAKMSTFGQMSAGIIHEIGQPLTAIKGYAELLEMGQPQEKQERYIITINREIDRLFNIIDKFRSFSRLSEEVFTPVSLNDVLNRTIDLMEHQLQIKNIRLDTSIEKNLPLISGDKNGLQQVILNLVTNAMDALEVMPKDARSIHIKAFSNETSIIIETTDTGCGIPEKISANIFDPFFTTKKEDKGTGLGLAIIDSILHKHKATIECLSIVNEGTTFKITIPMIKTSEVQKTK